MKKSVRHMRYFIVIVCIALGLSMVFVATRLKANDDVSKAVELLQQSADHGDATAQTKLGILYARGVGVVKDANKSVQLYQAAANQNNAVAQYLLARLYERGDGVPKDLNKAIHLFQQAVEEGYAPAQFYLGLLYQTGNGVVEDLSKAGELYQKAANQDYAPAEFFLGSLYEKGKGVPKSIDKAIELYERASQQGDDAATLYLGAMYEQGHDVSKDLKKAAEIYSKMADKGNRIAKQKLKKLQAQLSPSPAQQVPAQSAKKPIPEPDDCARKFQEALNYNSGMNSVHINGDETVKRLKSLATQSCPEAIAQLAVFAEEGNWAPSVPKSDKAAQELGNLAMAAGLQQRAEEGRPTAQYMFGFFYQHGLGGVAEDSDKGIDIRNEAAKAGYPEAQWWLASLFEKYNYHTDAIYWYQRAAAQGDAWAQMDLGILYEKGSGVPKDTAKAAELFRQAASQGLVNASQELRKMKRRK